MVLCRLSSGLKQLPSALTISQSAAFEFLPNECSDVASAACHHGATVWGTLMKPEEGAGS